MHYDPIKRTLGGFFNNALWMRVLFYQLLDLLLLRSWHIRKALNTWKSQVHNPKILDAGFGFGQYSYRMAQDVQGCEIVALDLKEEQVADCTDFFKRKGVLGVDFQVGDLTQYVRPNYYDLVL